MGAFVGLDATSPSAAVQLMEDAKTSLSSGTGDQPSNLSVGGGQRGATSAVTRSWSDVDPIRMMATFAMTSFAYSFFGQPFFLAIARQQCSKSSVSAHQVMSDVVRTFGVRGLYRGAGAAISGTVLSELVYYFVVEYAKEKLPFNAPEWRSFGAGLLADVASAPVFNPFGVVSQVQMVAGSAFSSEHNYMSAWRTAVTLVREQGVGSLFRGTLLTLAVTPLTGAWWFVYEHFKRQAYALAPAAAHCLAPLIPAVVLDRLPLYCTSTSDNALINGGVGAATSMVMGVVMNPVYVLRLRLQVNKKPKGVRFPLIGIARDIMANEGPRALMKGLGVNLFVGVVGGCAFGLTYEGAKKISDISDTKDSSR